MLIRCFPLESLHLFSLALVQDLWCCLSAVIASIVPNFWTSASSDNLAIARINGTYMKPFTSFENWSKALTGIQKLRFFLFSLGWLWKYVNEATILHWHHWRIGIRIVTLACSHTPDISSIGRLNNDIAEFCAGAYYLYSNRVQRPMFHLLAHMRRDIVLHGSLWKSSTYVFESQIKSLRERQRNSCHRDVPNKLLSAFHLGKVCKMISQLIADDGPDVTWRCGSMKLSETTLPEFTHLSQSMGRKMTRVHKDICISGVGIVSVHSFGTVHAFGDENTPGHKTVQILAIYSDGRRHCMIVGRLLLMDTEPHAPTERPTFSLTDSFQYFKPEHFVTRLEMAPLSPTQFIQLRHLD
jgi:hypothetical protein